MMNSTKATNQMQAGMGELQPRMQEIQEQYKDEPQKMADETMKLFRSKGGGPLKGCLMMVIQIPIFIGLFFVVKHFASGEINIESMYSFLQPFLSNAIVSENITHEFLGLDLYKSGGIILALVGGLLIYGQMKMSAMVKPKNAGGQLGAMQKLNPNMPDMSKFMGMMNIFLTISMVMFIMNTPSGVGVYVVT